MNYWKGKKVVVAGGCGFIGSYVSDMLEDMGAIVYTADIRNGSSEDLKWIDNCYKSCLGADVVMNLAAVVGGIEFNKTHQGHMLLHNLLINTNLLEAARAQNVKKFLVVSSACVYSHDVSIPTPESEGFIGLPEATNLGYGWAKRTAEVQAMTYHSQYGMNIVVARPYNCYGPGDHFEIGKSHVIPAIIERVFDGENPLKVWGSGNQSRSFIYVEDLARGLIDLVEKWDSPEPVNLGSNEEISIKDLVGLIVELSGKHIEVEFDCSKPDGSARRQCSNELAKKIIGFETKVGLKEGLTRTIDWYRKKYNV